MILKHAKAMAVQLREQTSTEIDLLETFRLSVFNLVGTLVLADDFSKIPQEELRNVLGIVTNASRGAPALFVLKTMNIFLGTVVHELIKFLPAVQTLKDDFSTFVRDCYIRRTALQGSQIDLCSYVLQQASKKGDLEDRVAQSIIGTMIVGVLSLSMCDMRADIMLDRWS